jgi:motility quorum-sensing regulator/GCU-specific mRNA interferase toxin
MTDKWMPHHDLEVIKSAFSEASSLRATKTALQGAAELGLSTEDIVMIIQTITKGHFYKSMTSNYDSAVWQDVYHVPHQDCELYVKFTDNGGSDLLLLSFKEK